MATQTFTASPHWIKKLLGSKTAQFYWEGNDLYAELKPGEQFKILSNTLTDNSIYQKGIIFSELRLKTSKGEKRFKGLQKTVASNAYDWFRQHAVLRIAPHIEKQSQQIKIIMAKGYLRSSRLTHIKKLANEAVNKFGTVPNGSWVTGINLDAFQHIYDISEWDDSHIEHLRNEYVSRYKHEFKHYFDNIESNPLTEYQRDACIIDEDNNLVLAGAGTGKTSTMVGRAGFLVSSKQTKPENILMLAFGKDATTEMQERIKKRLGNSGITASTFHSLGKNIIAQVEGAQPSLSPLADDDKLLAWHVNQWFEEHLEDKFYQKLAVEYFQHHLYPEANPFEFETEGEYFEYIQANDIRTLKGERVKSLGECLVANYLFKLGIEYQYEASYEHKTRDLTFRQYQPDFFLPEYGIYLEYFGIDKQGNTAPYIDRKKYHAGMQWKRELHKKHNTKLIEAFHYQLINGTLFESLDHELHKKNVTIKPLPPESILETLREFGAINAFASLLADLLRRYRANCYKEGQLDNVIKEANNPDQVKSAITLLLPIVDDYRALLTSKEHIDFDDMIGKAINYVRSNQFKSHWTYILVDEFQDISDPRARLVKCLKKSVNECSLFCVGDDWQAIYRFTGSDIRFTTEFEKVFGATKTTSLDLTFRFNNSINEVASRFVLENPSQVKKQLSTFSIVDEKTVSLLREDNRRPFGGSGVDNRILTVLKRINAIAKKGSSVYLLGRYGFNLPDDPQLLELNSQIPDLDIQAYTIHTSKGKEADYIVFLGLEKGKHGFPSRKVTHPLLDALLPKPEEFPFSEERRLFYVAITRARNRVYLIVDMSVASEFIIELLDNNYPLKFNEFDISLTQELFQLIHCLKCTTGILVSREGRNGSFFGCNNYPLCNYTEDGCSSCGAIMQHIGRFKVCTNPECTYEIPVCPECGADMIRRTGKNGMFWGCRNYKGNEQPTCKHTENEIILDASNAIN